MIIVCIGNIPDPIDYCVQFEDDDMFNGTLYCIYNFIRTKQYSKKHITDETINVSTFRFKCINHLKNMCYSILS